MGITASYNQGAGANYSPPAGILPFVANARDLSLGLTLRPFPRFRFDETYLYSELAARAGSPLEMGGTPAIFNNHISRSKLSFQFTRTLSLRAIVDYGGLLPNPSLVAQQRTKRISPDILLTDLLNPGTALYIGYHDQYDNLDIQAGSPPRLLPAVSPSTSIGRQFFVKISYLFL